MHQDAPLRSHSLNKQMLPGPRLQDDLSAIVMRWRKHRIVFTAYVERIYRRASIAEPMRIFQLETVTYGTTSAPYLAIKALQRLADDEIKNTTLQLTSQNENFSWMM